MEPYDSYDRIDPIQAASYVLFGSYYLMPAAIAILNRSDPEFSVRMLTHTNTERVGFPAVMARLQRLGLIEYIEGTSRPRRYVRVGEGGPNWELVRLFQSAMGRQRRGEQPELPRLSPPPTLEPVPWYDRIDVTDARQLAGSGGRIKLLLLIYLWPQNTFWLRSENEYCRRTSYPNPATIGLLRALNDVDEAYVYTRWQRLNSPLWSVVAGIWELLTQEPPINVSPQPYVSGLRQELPANRRSPIQFIIVHRAQ